MHILCPKPMDSPTMPIRLVPRAGAASAARRWLAASSVLAFAAAAGGCDQQKQGEWYQGVLLLGTLVAIADGTDRHDLRIDIVGDGSVKNGNETYETSTVIRRLRNDSVVTLTAEPDSGESFDSWSGACTGETTCTITMSDDRQVTAQFSGVVAVATERSLTMIITGPGQLIYSGGAYEGTRVLADIADGATVSLSASPTVSTTTHEWGGACDGTETACSLTMSQDRTVRLTFTASSGIAGARGAGPALAARLVAIPVAGGMTVGISDGDLLVRWHPEAAERYRLNAASAAGAGDFQTVAEMSAHATQARLPLEPGSADWLNRVYLLETCVDGRCAPALQAPAQLDWPTVRRAAFQIGATTVWATARSGQWLALARYARRGAGAVDGRLFMYRLDDATWRFSASGAPDGEAGEDLPDVGAMTPLGALSLAGDRIAVEALVDWPGQAPSRHRQDAGAR